MSNETPWTCPYCGRDTTLIENVSFMSDWSVLYLKGRCKQGNVGQRYWLIVCPNPKCRELTFRTALYRATFEKGRSTSETDQQIAFSQILPKSNAKPQPEFIPRAIRDDYSEACAISEMSPKASATLSRRCLQGMIRDFCGITKKRLVDEIDELRKRVDNGTAPAGVLPNSVDAIDYVRRIGNIAAHMEADVNLIIDVGPGEAHTLISLIETLFRGWYVAAEDRNAGLANLKTAAEMMRDQ